MKNDPQNGELKKELHNQQLKITALSEKQKKVVEQLRSELGIKKEPGTAKEPGTSPTPLSASQNLNIPQHRSHHKSHHHGSRPILGGTQPPTPPRMSILTNKPSMVAIKVPNVASRLSASRALTLKESKDSNSNIYKKPMLVPKHTFSTRIEHAIPRKALTPEEKKLEFMAALGLITQKTAEQLQSRRSERKRRSTANPQYSNFDRHDVESRRSATSFLAATNGLGQEKRRRGGHRSPDTENDINGLNGAIQVKGADLIEKGGQSWHSTMAVVNSYIQHKGTKEEEKKKLQRRAGELRNERLLLEQKAKQLNDAIAKQMIAKNTLMEHFRKTETAISQLKDFITLFPPQ
ncbi:PHD finger protein 21B-like isoform X2 [Amphiura filiformis]